MKHWLTLFLMIFLSSPAIAAIDTYEFKDEESRKRFGELTTELRCPKCQNQNLADSNSPIASDLRREVYRMVDKGESNDEIVDFMVSRYGEFVLYRPRVTDSTLVLWYGPAVLLAIGFVVVFLIARKRKRVTDNAGANLSADDVSKLDSLLNKDENK